MYNVDFNLLIHIKIDYSNNYIIMNFLIPIFYSHKYN